MPNVLTGRPELAPRLARGRRVDDLPALLGETAPGCDATLLLCSCPLWRDELAVAERLAALPARLEHRCLGMDLQVWLKHWTHDPETWARRRCAGERRSPVAALLWRLHGAVLTTTASRPLDLLHDCESTMPALAAQMAGSTGFGAQPVWHGHPAETGPWTRIKDRPGHAAHNGWMRMVSRWVDVLHLAAPGGGQWLAHGALSLGARAGIAWTEMARGLLVHRVQLDGPADAPRVADCRLLAPTEWNFRPHGVLAQALAALTGVSREAGARRLAVAFDPCVEFEIDTHPAGTEAAHA